MALGKKGVSPLVAAVILVVMAVVLSTFVSSWLSTFAERRSESLRNTTKTQLQCQFGGIFIKNATYNCAGNCSAGVAHNLTIAISNSGRISLGLNKVYVQNTSGNVFELDINTTTISPAITSTFTNTSTATCNGINRSVEKITVSSYDCPDAFDSLPGGDVVFASC